MLRGDRCEVEVTVLGFSSKAAEHRWPSLLPTILSTSRGQITEMYLGDGYEHVILKHSRQTHAIANPFRIRQISSRFAFRQYFDQTAENTLCKTDFSQWTELAWEGVGDRECSGHNPESAPGISSHLDPLKIV
ncbi:hypothetical protein M413DRAFT_391029 [Hebeloma cylindrosporum]|uniref:Uncharacterized protein n=1 Tax=Hebeloma cylindrosporum TaxID=76867 RepID=A0A0C2Y194_HEBCY|nr:hypothetical protein M413DRAFT_391029 [Hebeloma cylindrosporum h7]